MRSCSRSARLLALLLAILVLLPTAVKFIRAGPNRAASKRSLPALNAGEETAVLWRVEAVSGFLPNTGTLQGGADTWRNAFSTCLPVRDAHTTSDVSLYVARVDRDSRLCAEVTHGVRQTGGGRPSTSTLLTQAAAGDTLPHPQLYAFSAAACIYLRERLALPRPPEGRSLATSCASDAVGAHPNTTTMLRRGQPRRLATPALTIPPSQFVCGVELTPAVLDAACGRVLSSRVSLPHDRAATDAFGRGIAVAAEGRAVAGLLSEAQLGLDEGYAFTRRAYVDASALPPFPSSSSSSSSAAGGVIGLYARLDGSLYARGSPRTFFMWNKALAAACDVSPSVMVDDGLDFDSSAYKAGVDAFHSRWSPGGGGGGGAGQDGASTVPGTGEVPRAVTIYVVTPQLFAFVRDVVPHLRALRQPFIILSGSSDISAPLSALRSYDRGGGDRVRDVLGDPLLRAWFAQNPDVVHSKVVPLPIGFDFHTLSGKGLAGEGEWKAPTTERALHHPLHGGREESAQDEAHHRVASALHESVGSRRRAEEKKEEEAGGARTHHAWGPGLSVEEQDWSVQSLRCTLPPLGERPDVALLNFKTVGRGVRSQVASLLSDRPGIHAVTDVPRSSLWRAYGGASFVLSPPGYGRDCHRTWEALALGSIPIVAADHFLAPLYAHLPVVQVTRWDSVSLTALSTWKRDVLAQAVAGAYRWELLRTDWWLAVIQLVAHAVDADDAAARLETVWVYNVPGGAPSPQHAPVGRFVFPGG